MLKTFDFILIGIMTATATVTYTIKHQAELKLDEVKRLEAEIKLEKDTIDLLRADWALLTQPNRLEKLVKVYDKDLQLVPTESTQLVQPSELPMLRDELPAEEVADGKDGKSDKQKKTAENARKGADKITTGSVKP